MPKMSGIELLIEAKENFPEIPIMLMTGQSPAFSKEDARSSGADDYITKPFKNVEIVSKIRGCLMRVRRPMAKSK